MATIAILKEIYWRPGIGTKALRNLGHDPRAVRRLSTLGYIYGERLKGYRLTDEGYYKLMRETENMTVRKWFN